MNLLIFRDTFDTTAERLRSTCVDLGFCIMEVDGSITLNGTDSAEFDAAWGSVELYTNPGAPIKAFMLEVINSSSCRWFQSSSAGVENPAFRRIVDSGKVLTNSPATAPAIAEYVLAHCLARMHPLQAARDAQARKEWTRLPFRELGQCHWLVIGFGNIGREVALRAKAFGSTVTGVRRTPGDDPAAHKMITPAELPDAISEADIIVLSVAAGPDADQMVDANFLARTKPGALLVNISRGSVVDESALLTALDTGSPGHAVLDVFATEPLPADSPLWTAKQVTITAHTSSNSDGTVSRGVDVFANNLARFAQGESLAHLVPEAYLAPPRG